MRNIQRNQTKKHPVLPYYTIDMSLNSQLKENLLKPYWIIDILPRQVKAPGGGQYFKIEQFFLEPRQMDDICRKFARMVLKLNCFEDISVCTSDDENWCDNPAPEIFQKWILERKPLYVLLKSSDAMIAFSGEDHYLTLYSDKDVSEMIRILASAEGLFVWKPDNNE